MRRRPGLASSRLSAGAIAVATSRRRSRLRRMAENGTIATMAAPVSPKIALAAGRNATIGSLASASVPTMLRSMNGTSPYTSTPTTAAAVMARGASFCGSLSSAATLEADSNAGRTLRRRLHQAERAGVGRASGRALFVGASGDAGLLSRCSITDPRLSRTARAVARGAGDHPRENRCQAPPTRRSCGMKASL
jgi:hypothetical protein